MNFGEKVSLLFFRASADGDIWFFIIGLESPANATKVLYKKYIDCNNEIVPTYVKPVCCKKQ